MSELQQLSVSVSHLASACGRLTDQRSGATSTLRSAANAAATSPEGAAAAASIQEAIRIWAEIEQQTLAAARAAHAYAISLA